MKTEQPTRHFKGIWIPKHIWEHPDLSWLEKCLVAEIDSLSSEKEPCRASNQWFAKRFGVSHNQIAKWLVRLRKNGVIETVGFNGRQRFLKATFAAARGKAAIPKSEQQLFQKGNSSYSKNGIPQNPIPTNASAGKTAENGSGENSRENSRENKKENRNTEPTAPVAGPSNSLSGHTPKGRVGREPEKVPGEGPEPGNMPGEKPEPGKTLSQTTAAAPSPAAAKPTPVRDFIAAWCDRYKKATGNAYDVVEGVDAGQAKRLLAGGSDPEKLLALAERAWKSDGFYAKQCHSLAGFVKRVNDVRNELDGNPGYDRFAGRRFANDDPNFGR